MTDSRSVGKPSNVALYTSAWIEIGMLYIKVKQRHVALYTSAWIEI